MLKSYSKYLFFLIGIATVLLIFFFDTKISIYPSLAI